MPRTTCAASHHQKENNIMTPAARIQASIELWDKIQAAHVPMDKICGDYFRTRRFIGSKDRANVAERVYTMMRAYARLGWWCAHLKLPDDARTRAALCVMLIEGIKFDDLTTLFNGRKYHPDDLSPAEVKALKPVQNSKIDHEDMDDATRHECPEFAFERLQNLYGDGFADEMQAMIPPATLDVRVNTIKTDREQIKSSLSGQDVESDFCPYSPVGLRLKTKAFLSKTKAFTKGLIEIQDEGSQLLALICGAKPGMQVMDYCAGGGGKTLALAAAMNGKGRIVGMDLHGKRLAKSKPRLTRADVHNVELRPLDDDKHKKWFRRQKKNFDIVLVDAPCSSSGTWRRNPDLRWNMYGPTHAAIQEVQQEILEKVKGAVKHGGRLVYATCSLFREENEDQVDTFLKNNPDFKRVPVEQAWNDAGLETPCPVSGDYLRLSPKNHGTDGFFAATLERIAEE